MVKFVSIVIYSWLSGCILARNTDINVSLETVFEFNKKDRLNDLQVLDEIQHVIDYVRNELLSPTKNKSINNVKEVDLRKHRPIKLHPIRKTMKILTPKIMLSDINKVTSNKIKERAKTVSDSYYHKKIPLKPMINLISIIIRALKDQNIKAVINKAHKETLKSKYTKFRRAMREGLDILKETPVDSIREFLKEITENDRIKFKNEEHRKLNKAFEIFFTELDKLLSQMDPESKSLLTLIFHDLEKVFIKELEKSRLKVLNDANRDFRKLRSYTDIDRSDENDLLDTVTEALKSLVYDKYGSLNENEKSWVKSKLKPLWANVRKFFDNDVKNNMRKIKTGRKNIKWFGRKEKNKYAESSISIEDAPESVVTMSLQFENSGKENTFNILTKTDNTNLTDYDRKIIGREKMCSISRDKCDKDNGTRSVPKGLSVTTPENYIKGKTHRVLNISRLTASFMDYLPFNITFNKEKPYTITQTSVESIDEMDKANRKYEGKQNPRKQHRFRVLDGYNSVISVTRTTLKPRITLKFWEQSPANQLSKRQNQEFKDPNLIVDKTTHIGLSFDGNIQLSSNEVEKPSRTTLKDTTPLKINECIKQICNQESLRRRRLKQFKDRTKSDLDTFEYNSNESDRSDLSIETYKKKNYTSLVKRIDKIEEKIQKIENIIQTKKTTNGLLNVKRDHSSNNLLEFDKVKNKARSTTSNTIYKRYSKNIEDNEVLEKSSKTSNYHVTESSTSAKMLKSTKDTDPIKIAQNKMADKSLNISEETTTSKVSRVNKITEDSDWIINI